MLRLAQRFRVKPGAKVSLRKTDPDYLPPSVNKVTAKKAMKRLSARLNELQEMFYANHKQALLVCLQAIDTGGKDGTIEHVFGAMNPQGCRVASFRQPNQLEQDHDFLWRAHRDAPAKGEVVIFNRSHYEDVLAVRIHDLAPKKIWSKHYDQINAFEEELTENGTHVLKFFLHIGKDEQLERFKDRLDDPTKHWKISATDYTERAKWNQYMDAFEDMLSKCSTRRAPWFVIPANHKWFRDLAVATIMVDYLEGIGMRWPKPKANLKKIQKCYETAKRQK